MAEKNGVQHAQDIAYKLAKLANSGPIPCSEGYGPVWELYRQLQAAIWKLATPVPGGVTVPHGETFSRPDADALESNK